MEFHNEVPKLFYYIHCHQTCFIYTHMSNLTEIILIIIFVLITITPWFVILSLLTYIYFTSPIDLILELTKYLRSWILIFI